MASKPESSAKDETTNNSSTEQPRAEEPVLHVIYPKDPANKGQTDAITKLIDGFVVDKTKIYASESKYLGIFFWSAPLTKSQAETVRANSNVGAVGVQCIEDCYDPALGDTGDGESALEKRDGGLVKQQNAAPEMVFMSRAEELRGAHLKD